MHKPSKADVLKVAEEPVAWLWETAAETGRQRARPHPNLGVAVVPLYTESQLLAMYAAGIESAKADGWRQCAVGQHTSQFCGQLEAAVAAEREVSDKLEKALVKLIDRDLTYFGGLATFSRAEIETARATLAEVAALRKKENA